MSYKDWYPKVLIAVPTYEGKDYIFKEFYQNLLRLSYPNADFIIIDNSPTMRYLLKLRRKGYKNIYHVPRGDNSRQALCNAQNYARTKMLDEGYDYLLFIESDLLPPPDTIERLMAHNKPVVGVFYLLGAGTKKVPCIFLKEYKSDSLGMGTRLIRPDEYENYTLNGLQLVHGTGLGTTLIRRDIMQRFYFWHDERFVDKHSDVYFYMDLDNNGIPVFVDTDIVVEHYPSKWEDVKDK
jgi:GT2 family glycosyltransferase